MHLNHYETTIIIHPSLDKGEEKKLIQTYKKLLKEEGAKLVHEENSGIKNLAYPIQKQTTGIYHTIRYQALGTTIEKLENAFKIDENIIRFLSVKLDKHGVIYHAERRERLKKEAEDKEKTKSTTDQES